MVKLYGENYWPTINRLIISFWNYEHATSLHPSRQDLVDGSRRLNLFSIVSLSQQIRLIRTLSGFTFWVNLLIHKFSLGLIMNEYSWLSIWISLWGRGVMRVCMLTCSVGRVKGPPFKPPPYLPSSTMESAYLDLFLQTNNNSHRWQRSGAIAQLWWDYKTRLLPF